MKQYDKKKEWGILGALFVFGIIYNDFIKWLEDRGYHEGYVSYLVAIGTAITVLASIPIVGIKAAMKILKCFIASGTPMILGSCWRHVKDRSRAWAELEEILGGMGNGNTAKNRGYELESGDSKREIGQ